MSHYRRFLVGVAGPLLLALGASLSPFAAGQAQTAAVAEAQGAPRQITVTILGLGCPFCAYGVEQKLKRLPGVAELKVELATGLGVLTLADGADLANDLIRKTIKDAGFEAAKITRNFRSDHPDWDRPPRR